MTLLLRLGGWLRWGELKFNFHRLNNARRISSIIMKGSDMRALIIISIIIFATQARTEILIHCGPSNGQAYFFNDPTFNPNPSGWQEDGMSKGRIILSKEGEDWDILFGDALGSNGYRSDGATVIPLASNERFIRVGAFADHYSDVYNFNLIEKTVVWSSNKSGPLMGKVAVYFSDCN